MNSSRLRVFVQFGFLGFLTWLGYRHQVLGGGPEGVPPVDALCPFGGLESLYSVLASGEWLRRLAPSAMVLLFVLVAMTLLFGRVFCGWICPLGTLGEWTSRAGARLGIRKRELHVRVDAALRWLKYVVLVLIIAATWKAGTLVWRSYDPWVAWMHLSAGWDGFAESPWSFFSLFVLVIGLSLFIERFWCRYLCPLGAFLAPLQKIGLVKVRRSDEECIQCHRCGQVCPVRLDPEAKKVETSAECIACGRCVEACPEETALFFGTKTLKTKVITVGALAMMLYSGGYGLARATGYWQTYASPSISSDGNPTEAQLYGWMTLENVSKTLEVSVEEILAAGSLPDDFPRDVPLKKIEGVNDEELLEKIKTSLESNIKSAPASLTPPNPDEIKGSMTMQEISKTWNLEGVKVFETAGWPADTRQDVPLKTLEGELGKSVTDIREAVKKLSK
ncbi:MAG: 4Fe-4S binding protein [Thermovirgaceae bacterium]|nr:4Fe-4S binding protein [Thermovirgaceae bacterium]